MVGNGTAVLVAYMDLPNWPAMTEHIVHQTFGRTSFYWGYLAARPDR